MALMNDLVWGTPLAQRPLPPHPRVQKGWEMCGIALERVEPHGMRARAMTGWTHWPGNAKAAVTVAGEDAERRRSSGDGH